MELNLNKSEVRLLRKSLTEYIDYLAGFDNEFCNKRILDVRELRIKLRDIVLTRAAEDKCWL